MSWKSFEIVLVLSILGFTVCRSHSDFRRHSNATMLEDDGIDFTADNEIVLPKHVDIIEPVHGSYNQPCEHGTRNRRASDGVNGSLIENANEDKIDMTSVIAPENVTSSTSIPTTTPNGINAESPFEVYFADFLKKHPDVQVLRSPKHFDNQNKTWTLSVKDGRNVEVIIHLLDINPFSNFLSIRAVHEDNSSAQVIAGPISPKNVQTLKVMDTQEIVVYYHFANSQSSKYDGFVLTYKSFGEPPKNETSNSTETIPLQEYSSIKILLEVPQAMQNNETLAQLRLLFAQSANKFIAAEKLAIETCKIENVKFVDVLHCPSTWPNTENCIQIVLAIPLRTITNATALSVKQNASASESGEVIDGNQTEHELTMEHLLQMWFMFGRSHFAENEFHEFTAPITKNLILLWASISLGVLILFLLTLYGICQIDLLKDYRRMHWKMSDDQSRMCKQSEIDISMFPSPHQAVPTLFPNDLTTYSSAPTVTLPYEYINQPISFSQSDFMRRGSLEESLKLDDVAIEKHEAGVVPFQSEIIDFNEPHAEDEITFSRAATDSPRGQITFRTCGKSDSIS